MDSFHSTPQNLALPSHTSSLSLHSAPSSPRRATAVPATNTNLVVFSGGSAANSLVDVFEHVRAANSCSLSYVIPISDNGGSTSEIIRVFGGPGIGDVRSRLVRLIPSNDRDEGDHEPSAIRRFFNHRLPGEYKEARGEWSEIVESTHELWNGISTPKRELIRSILNSFNLEAVKRVRPSSRFDYSGASIGNLFLTGARLFTGSFEAAIYLFSSICAVPERVAVLPALNSNFAHHIAAGLADGTVITGQNDISHPSAPSNAVPGVGTSTAAAAAAAAGAAGAVSEQDDEMAKHDNVEDANLPGSLPALRRPAISFSKEQEEDLPARIERVWYINPYGQEIRTPANPRVLDALRSSNTVVYSIGSLFTSLIPNLVLKGVGALIASPTIRNKILILNGTTDRETGPSTNPFTALDFVAAIANACADSQGLVGRSVEENYVRYVTHVIYIEGPGSPRVDVRRFKEIGIDTMRLYGPSGGGNRYDGRALQQALETIVGRKDRRQDRSRRNTLDG